MIPSQVCIKRKRNQDPLQALYLDRSVKKSKPATPSSAGLNYFFKLGGIGSNSPPSQQDVVMAEAVTNNDKQQHQNQFKLKKQQSETNSNSGISDSLADMVQSYLHFQSQVDATASGSADSRRLSSSTTDDYVYDVYYREAASSSLPIDTGKSSLPQGGGYGFLIFNENDQDGESVSFLLDEDDNKSEGEDEDSNAEEYYGNDYPDEEERDESEQEEGSLSSNDDEWYSDYRERTYF